MSARGPLMLSGVIPPIVTPLDATGSVDVASLRSVIDFVLDAGVSAIFVCGTGGEGPYLSASKRQQVIEESVRYIDHRVPVLIGVSDIGTERAGETVRLACSAGADGAVSTAPFYGEVGDAEIERHFRLLAEMLAPLPLFAYDIPSKVHTKLSSALVARLAHAGVIAGIKDSSGDLDGFREVRLATADVPGFSLITGSDSFADAALSLGAAGMIAGLANVDPHGYVRLYDAARRGDHDAARAEQDRLFTLRRMCTVAASRVSSFSATIGAFKTAMRALGVIEHDALQPPLCGLNDDEAAEVVRILGDAKLVVEK